MSMGKVMLEYVDILAGRPVREKESSGFTPSTSISRLGYFPKDRKENIF